MSEDTSIHPDAMSWLSRAGLSATALNEMGAENEVDGSSTGGTNALLNQLRNWHPQTLKQISTHALALGKASGQPLVMMKWVADIEIKLKLLRDRIGISRKAGNSELVRSTVLVKRPNEWVSLGKWIPDILDRAAAFDPIHATKSSDDGAHLEHTDGSGVGFSAHKQRSFDRTVSLAELRSVKLEHVIVLNDASPGASDSEILQDQVLELRQNDPNCSIHVSRIPHKWFSSGPEVFDAVFEAAFFIHGIKE